MANLTFLNLSYTGVKGQPQCVLTFRLTHQDTPPLSLPPLTLTLTLTRALSYQASCSATW